MIWAILLAINDPEHYAVSIDSKTGDLTIALIADLEAAGARIKDPTKFQPSSQPAPSPIAS